MKNLTLKNIINALQWSLIGLLIAVALIISLMRGILSNLDSFDTYISDYFKNQYDISVHFGPILSNWHQQGINIELTEFDIPEQGQLPFDLTIAKAYIRIDLWQSFLTQTLVVNKIDFNGVNLNLQQTTNTREELIFSDNLYDIFFQQFTRISLTNLQLAFKAAGQQSPAIQIKNLTWINQDNEHYGTGTLYHEQPQMTSSQSRLPVNFLQKLNPNHLLTPNNRSKIADTKEFDLQIKLKSDGKKLNTLEGDWYLAAKKVKINQWFDYLDTRTLDVDSEINFEAWGKIKNFRLENAMFEFHPSFLTWSTGTNEQSFKIERGRLQWQPRQEGWLLSSHRFLMSSNGANWENFDVSMRYKDNQFRFHSQEIHLNQLMPLMPLIPSLSAEDLDAIIASNPQGLLEDYRLQTDSNGNIYQQMFVNDLTWGTPESTSYLSPAQFEFYSHNNYYGLKFPSQVLQARYASEFDDTLQITLHDNWLVQKTAGNQVDLFLPDFEIGLNEAEFRTNTHLIFADNAPTFLALTADARVPDARKIKHLLPKTQLGEALYNYLSNAFVKGTIDHARILWHGALQDYPYNDRNGQFEAHFVLNDAIFNFDDEWPVIDNLKLNALFSKDAMALKIDQGSLLNANIKGARIDIPELGSQSMLLVNSDIKEDSGAISELMQASSLKSSVGQALDILQLSKEITGVLKLQIPLFETSVVQHQIEGIIHFNQNPLYLATPGIPFDAVNGNLSFKNSILSSEDLTFTSQGQITQVNLRTHELIHDGEESFFVNLNLDGHVNFASLAQHIDSPLASFYSGSFNWDGFLNLELTNEGHRLKLEFDTDLKDSNLSFPKPLSKPISETKKLSLSVTGDKKSTQFFARLGNELEIEGAVKHSNQQVSYDMMLGRLFTDKDTRFKDQGHIQFELQDTKLQPWLDVIEALGTQAEQSAKDSTLPALRHVHGTTETLDISGWLLQKAKVSAAPTKQGWDVTVDSDRIDGTFTFFPDWRKQGIKLVADRISIDTQTTKNGTRTFNDKALLKQLPPLAINLKTLELNDEVFNQIMLQGAPLAQGYHVQTFAINDEKNSVRLSGKWNEDLNQTNIKFKVESETLEGFLKAMGTSQSQVKAKQLRSNGSISWPGSPLQVDVNKMNGSVHIEAKEGLLVNVQNKGLDIIGALSISALVRKFSVDFSDEFKKGLFFDDFSSDLILKNGLLITPKTKINGLAVSIEAEGQTDLIKETLNYRIRANPKIGSVVPTVALFVGGFTTGLLTFAATKALEPVIDVITELNYEVTGPIKEPIFKEVSRDNRTIEVPQDVIDASKEQESEAAKMKNNNLPNDQAD